MNKVRRWLFRKIVRDHIKQSPVHHLNLTELYRMIFEEARKEFTEDNDVTLMAFCAERFVEVWDEDETQSISN